MNRRQRFVLVAGVALGVLSGLFPPFTEVRSSGGVYSGAGPRGRGEEQLATSFRGYDFILSWRGDGTDLNGGLHRYAPDFALLGLQWLALLAGTGGLWYALRGTPTAPDAPAAAGSGPGTGRDIG